jgi:hypothetical protein
MLPLLLSACGAPDDAVYTLYRDDVFGLHHRIHVASFDTRDSKEYNRENCEAAQALFQTQPGVTTRFWCEQGRFKS